ncbi:MAG TPA: type II toxin-antitoxin system Phd/YefM family antitoxin [Labilithrix sp.]|nr:type II toxin-antitoxin system Phd/YefM family antitoxin [Labilithrix sp.]
MKRVSVAEAKNHLPALLHEAEESGPIEIMRHEKPVAVIVAHDEFERLKRSSRSKRSFSAVLEWREKHSKDLEVLDVAGVLAGTRERKHGRPVKG